MSLENIEEKGNDYDPAEDPEFINQAINACLDLGLPQDEAETMVDDYLGLY